MAQPAISPVLRRNTNLNSADEVKAGKSADVDSVTPISEPHPNFSRVVDDAMWLLMHAAETGRPVDDATRNNILHAKAAVDAGWGDAEAANLLSALTKLAAELSPVTADSLRASCSGLTKPAITTLRWWTAVLAVPIILFSVLGFVSSAISNAIRTDIVTANELVVKLRGELGTERAPTAGTAAKPELPKGLNEGDVITQLQQYASTIRAIDARARQLNWFVFNSEWDHFADVRWNPHRSPDENKKRQELFNAQFQIPAKFTNMPQTLDTLTATYQDVRSFAQDILDLVSVYYGAVTSCLLPVLYALLGTCAYLLRSFDEELRTLTFMPSSRANWARFLIAGIGGAVVGLFGNLTITEGASISPLAIAFLVGYAVDVFFSFLEGLLQAFTKNRSRTSSPAPVSSNQ